MLSYYTRRSVGEDFQRIQNPRSHNVWVRGDQVSAHELQHLAEVYGLNYGTLNDILDENELPRVETRGNETYVFLRTAQHTKRGEVRTMPFLVVLKDSVFRFLLYCSWLQHSKDSCYRKMLTKSNTGYRRAAVRIHRAAILSPLVSGIKPDVITIYTKRWSAGLWVGCNDNCARRP